MQVSTCYLFSLPGVFSQLGSVTVSKNGVLLNGADFIVKVKEFSSSSFIDIKFLTVQQDANSQYSISFGAKMPPVQGLHIATGCR